MCFTATSHRRPPPADGLVVLASFSSLFCCSQNTKLQQQVEELCILHIVWCSYRWGRRRPPHRSPLCNLRHVSRLLPPSQSDADVFTSEVH